MNELEEILHILDLPNLSRRIYLLLLTEKALTPKAIADKLSSPRPSIYDHLKILQNKNLILETKIDGKKTFVKNNPEVIQVIIQKQKTLLDNASIKIKNILPKLQKIEKSVEPKIQFFSGLEGIKSVQDDILWYKNIDTQSLWPTSKLIHLIGTDYLKWHNQRRKEENISVKIIRQGEKIDEKKYPYLKTGKEFLRETKYLKSKEEVQMSYWIYGDKVAFFDPSSELYAFIVHSKSFANLMKIQFEFIWKSL